MLGVCDHFGAVESYDVIRDDLERLVLEIGVVDA